MRRYLLIGERDPAEAIICGGSGRAGIGLPGAGYRRFAAIDCREGLEE